jgi:hypothetical protein
MFNLVKNITCCELVSWLAAILLISTNINAEADEAAVQTSIKVSYTETHPNSDKLGPILMRAMAGEKAELKISEEEQEVIEKSLIERGYYDMTLYLTNSIVNKLSQKNILSFPKVNTHVRPDDEFEYIKTAQQKLYGDRMNTITEYTLMVMPYKAKVVDSSTIMLDVGVMLYNEKIKKMDKFYFAAHLPLANKVDNISEKNYDVVADSIVDQLIKYIHK